MKHILFFFFFLFFLFSGCSFLRKEEVTSSEVILDTTITKMYVEICGGVRYPGVYEVSTSTRVFELIQYAGGTTLEADITSISLCDVLEENQKVIIPFVIESEETKVNKININTAKKEELMTLPGIKESLADAIITYRREHGYFKAITEIMNVSGIKEAKFEAISSYITI